MESSNVPSRVTLTEGPVTGRRGWGVGILQCNDSGIVLTKRQNTVVIANDLGGKTRQGRRENSFQIQGGDLGAFQWCCTDINE